MASLARYCLCGVYLEVSGEPRDLEVLGAVFDARHSGPRCASLDEGSARMERALHELGAGAPS